MKRKKVLLVLYNASPLRSGAAVQALMLKKHLDKDFDIQVLSIDSNKTSDRSIKRVFVGGSVLQKIVALFYLTFLIPYLSKDIVHYISLSRTTFFSMIISKLMLRKVIVKMTMFDVDDAKTIKNSFFYRHAYKLIDHWVAIAPGMMDEYFNNNVFIPNAVSKSEARRKGSNYIFICSGVICERKNQLSVLKFWESLMKSCSQVSRNAKLIFIGSFENDYIEYNKDYIEAFLAQASHFDNVYVKGHVDDVSSYLSEASYYVSFSLREGLSNSLLEALSYGLYPIVYDVNKFTLADELYEFGCYFDDFCSIGFHFEDYFEKHSLEECLDKYYSTSRIINEYRKIYGN